MFKKVRKNSWIYPFKSLICLIAHHWVSILQMASLTRSSPKVNRSRPVVYKLLTFDEAIPKGKLESEGTPVFVSVQNGVCNMSYLITLYMFIFSSLFFCCLFLRFKGYRFYFCIWKSMCTRKDTAAPFWNHSSTPAWDPSSKQSFLEIGSVVFVLLTYQPTDMGENMKMSKFILQEERKYNSVILLKWSVLR